jgi:septum formation protein
MLEFLQACGDHEVWTGVCLIGPDGGQVSRADVAGVHFAAIPGVAVEEYLQGTEWQDKAGAYAIQGWAGAYARLASGDMGTVVGLSENAVLALFEASGLPPGAFRR